MKRLAQLLCSFLGLALIGASARAQVKPVQHETIPIQISFASKADIDCGLGWGELNGSEATLYPVGHINKSTWNKEAPRDFTITPGVVYVIHLSGSASDWDSTDVRVSPPAGYQVSIASPASAGPTTRTSYLAAPIVGVTDHHYAFLTVRPTNGTQQMGFGQATAPYVKGDFFWSFGLGVNSAGRSVGAVQLRLGAIDSSAFDPARLIFDSLLTDVTVTQSSGYVTGVTTPQGYFTVSPHTGGYTVNMSTGASFEFVNDSGPLKITRTEGSRTTTWRVTQTGTTVKSWTIEEVELGRTTTYSSTTVSGDRHETVTVADGSSVVAIKTKRIYRVFTSGTPEELYQEIADPDTAALTTTYDYYYNTSTDSGKGWWGKLKSVTKPDGSWIKYDYYGDGTLGEYGRWGLLKATYAPWQNAPSAVSSATTTNCAYTLYDYAAERSVYQEIPILTETHLLGITTSKSTNSPSWVQDAASRWVRADTATTYTDATHSLTTTRATYSSTENENYAGKLYSQVNPDGTKLSAYVVAPVFNTGNGTWSSAHVTISGWSSAVTGSTSAISTMDGYGIDPIYLVPNRSTRRREVLVTGGTSYQDVYTEVYTSSGTWEQIGHTQTRYDGAYKIFDYDALTGAYAVKGWAGGVPVTDVSNDGVLMEMSYDSLKRLLWKRKDGVSATSAHPSQTTIYTHYTYDAAGHTLTERTSNSPSPTSAGITTSHTFDLAGRPSTDTDPTGLVTSYAYDAANRTSTVTAPGGATKITTSYRDGSPRRVGGTGVTAAYTAVTVNSDGTLTKKTYALRSSDASAIDAATTDSALATALAAIPRWTSATTDWAGRTLKEEYPTYNGGTVFTKQTYYDSVGRPYKTTEPGVAPTLTVYNAYGEAYRTGLDVDNDGALTLASNDRISETTTVLSKIGSDWWSVATSIGYQVAGSSTPYTKGVVKTRLTGFTLNSSTQVFQQKEVKSIDLFGNETVQTVVVDRANKLVTETTDVPDSSTNAVTVAYNGLTESKQSAQGLVSRIKYDALNRVLCGSDPRIDNGVAYTSLPDRVHYETNTTRVDWRKDTAGNQTSYTYDSAGRLATETNPQSKLTRYSYTARGESYRVWGDATYPVEYAYNDYGEKTTMSTYRAGTGWTGSTWPSSLGTADTTTWSFEAATGLLLSKTDAASRHVDYTYTNRGQLYTRTWGRSTVTTYSYSSTTGEQLGIDYGDSTPDITYTYNRLGQTATVADITGSRTFNYHTTGTLISTLDNETLDSTYYGGRVLTRSNDTTGTGTLGRSTGFTISGASGSGTDYGVTYGYDASGRFNSVTRPSTDSFTYTYKTNSNLVDSIAHTAGWSQTMHYNSSRDLLDDVENKFSTTIKAKFAYAYDELGRRTSRLDTGEEFDRYQSNSLHTLYGYNDRSEVTGANSYYGTTLTDVSSPVLGRDYGYNFDTIGNRTTASVAGATTSYTANNLNQYTQRTVPGTASVSGLAPTGANVTFSVNGGTAQTVSRQGAFYYRDWAVSNAGTPLWLSFAVASDLGGSSTRGIFLPQTPEAYTYDLDGNILTDGRWSYTWDAENRLTSIEPISAASAITPSADRKKLVFQYDYLGRRVRKTVSTWNGSAYATATDRKFIYDGWNLIAEHDVLTSGLPAINRYVWGLDLSGTMQDGGGVRGLLAVLDPGHGLVHLPCYDGNGNVFALLNGATGAFTACYEYSSFGETIRATGSFAADNPFRFSTRYTDNETGYLYYGRRYYDPKLGRWMGRDPMQEKGGLHLYSFVRNDSINRYDVLGMHLPTDQSRLVEEDLPDGRIAVIRKWYNDSGDLDEEVVEIRESPQRAYMPSDPYGDPSLNYITPADARGMGYFGTYIDLTLTLDWSTHTIPLTTSPFFGTTYIAQPVHQIAIDRALSQLSSADRKILKDTAVEADSSQYQTARNSYRHAMSDGTPRLDGTGPMQTPAEARREANDFVRAQILKARELEALGGQKNHEAALREFGFGLHTIQDDTSPVHRGFQPWEGNALDLIPHGLQEAQYPGDDSDLFRVTQKAYRYFTGQDPLPDDFFLP